MDSQSIRTAPEYGTVVGGRLYPVPHGTPNACSQSHLAATVEYATGSKKGDFIIHKKIIHFLTSVLFATEGIA